MYRSITAALLLAATVAAHAELREERTPVVVSEATRLMVLEEMRGFVTAVGEITGALSRGDMEAAAAAAQPHGLAAMQQFPRERMMEMPESFRMLGRSVHEDFDRLAADARAGGDVSQALATLSQALAKCGGCHAAYRLEASSN